MQVNEKAVRFAKERIWEAEEDQRLDYSQHPEYETVRSGLKSVIENTKQKLTLDEVRSIEEAIAAEARLQSTASYLLGFKEASSLSDPF